MKEHHELEYYNRRKNMSNYWYNRAVCMSEAAEVLYDTEGQRHSGLLDPSYMLAGLSLEGEIPNLVEN